MIQSVKLGITDEHRSRLLDGIYNPDVNNKGPRAKVTGKTYTEKTLYNYNEHFLDFSNKVLDAFSNFFEGEFGIGSMWGIGYSKGDEVYRHYHHQWKMSFVYFVQCCEKCSPLVFPIRNQKFKPVTDNLLMFPNWKTSEHYVPKQQCDHDRVVISGNVTDFVRHA